MSNEAAPPVASSQVADALNLLVLHTLEKSGPLHGYRIATLLDRFVGPQDAPLDLRTLYSAILRQKQRGLLSASFAIWEGRQVRCNYPSRREDVVT